MALISMHFLCAVTKLAFRKNGSLSFLVEWKDPGLGPK